jgi:phosphatidylserine decarboxylase
MRIAREGWPFIFPGVLLAVLAAWQGWWGGFLLFFALAGAFTFFFRDPRRLSPGGENGIISPADGKVLAIETLPAANRLADSATRIKIFLSLLDVHVTRSPVSGTVRRVERRSGRFFPAYRDEAGEQNKFVALSVKGDTADVFLKLIVGVAARRIKCRLRENDRVERGQKIGLMYFGSRVEIDFPVRAQPRVVIGQKVRAGETVLAEVKN